MHNSFFITGTDTNIGKTVMTCALIEHFKNKGHIVNAMKPVAAGEDIINGLKINPDVEKFTVVNSTKIPLKVINPYSFDEAIAPHIAANRNNKEVNLDYIKKQFLILQNKSEYLFVEGAGGYLVPLNESKTISDLISYLDIPIILVVGIRLGCINHTMLTVESIKNNNQQIFGWIANTVESDMEGNSENLDYLKKNINAPLIGNVPFLNNIDSKKNLNSFLLNDDYQWPLNRL